MIGPLGIRNTFRLMGILCAVTCITYFIVNHIFFRKLQNQRRAEKKEQKKAEETEEGNAKEGKGDGKEGKGDLKDVKGDPKEAKGDPKESLSLEALGAVENGVKAIPNGKETKVP
nr:uncharacterized protein LOC113803608 [Penaeus vannamei]